MGEIIRLNFNQSVEKRQKESREKRSRKKAKIMVIDKDGNLITTKEQFIQEEKAKQKKARKEYELEVKKKYEERQAKEKDLYSNEQEYKKVFGTAYQCKIQYESLFIENDHTDCPHCDQYVKIWRIKRRKFSYICSNCKRQFSLFTNTPFRHSRKQFDAWFDLIDEDILIRGGLLFSEANHIVGCSTKTSRRMLNVIRSKVYDQDGFGIFEGDQPVATDTMGLYAKNGFRKIINKLSRKQNKAQAKIINTFHQVKGWAKAFYSPDEKKSTLEKFIKENVSKSCPVFTDGSDSYADLHEHGYTHEVVIHSENQYVRRIKELINGVLTTVRTVTTNGPERIHAVIRRNLRRHGNSFSIECLNMLLNKIIFDINLSGYSQCEKLMFGLRNTLRNRTQKVRVINNVIPLSFDLNYEFIEKIAA